LEVLTVGIFNRDGNGEEILGTHGMGFETGRIHEYDAKTNIFIRQRIYLRSMIEDPIMITENDLEKLLGCGMFALNW